MPTILKRSLDEAEAGLQARSANMMKQLFINFEIAIQEVCYLVYCAFNAVLLTAL